MSTKEEQAAYMREFNRRRKKAGICQHCGKPLDDRSKPLHPECRAYKNAQRQIYRNERVAKGLCSECDNAALPGHRVCQEHLLYKRKQSQERVRRLEEAGLCILCAVGVKTENRLCQTCSLKALASKYLHDRARWSELLAMVESQNWRCPYSGRTLVIGGNASVDHIVPVSKGGTDDISNLQFVDYDVQIFKWNHDVTYFLALIKEIYANTHAA